MKHLHNTHINRRFLDHLSDGFILVNHQNVVTYANDTAKNLLKLNNYYYNKTIVELLSTELSHVLLNKILESQRLFSNHQFEIYLENTNKQWIDVCISTNEVGTTVQFRNITTQKNEMENKIYENQSHLVLLNEATNQLKNMNTELSNNFQVISKREKLFKNIFNGAKDGIMLIDKNGVIKNANPSACHQLRIDRNDLVGKNYRETLAIIKHDSNKNEVTICLKDGAVNTYEYSVSKNHGISGTILVTFRNITTKKKAEIALYEAKQVAEQSSKAKSKFLSMMSHELRTPLNSIIGFSDVLLDDRKNSLNEVQTERVNKIRNAGKHLIDLINKILDHINLEYGKLTISIEKIHLTASIHESIQLIQPLADSKNILIECFASEDCYVKADKTRLRQVLINLLTNAVKYNNLNGTITIKTEILENEIKVIIEDTGIGISHEYQDSIFEPFFRIYDSEMNIEGTGIGLALVKNFISLMNGYVGVESTHLNGSRFWFSLPHA